MSAFNTPSPSPQPFEHPSPRKFKPGPVLNFEDDDVATLTGNDRTQAHNDAASMLLGYGVVRLGTITLKHGVVSARPKSAAALQRLEESFEENGVLRYSNPIILLVELSELESTSPLALKLDWDIPSVSFPAPADGSKPVVVCLAGQHREEAILRRVRGLESDLASLEKSADQDESAITAINDLKSCIEGERIWAAAFYEKSKVLQKNDASATAVGNLLTSNQRLWQWEATPQELWQLGCRWIDEFGTEKKVLLKAIGETRRFRWLGRLLVNSGWRAALTTVLKYSGLNKDGVLKECGQWCSQPYSQIALLLLEGVVVRMVAVSSRGQTHYPQLWTSELADFLVKQWNKVNQDIQKSPSSDHASLVDQYHKKISERLCKDWKNVIMEDGEDHPTAEEVEKVIDEVHWGSGPVLLSWEGIRPTVSEWKACGEGLDEVARWLDPGMGDFHCKTKGSVKLPTATEYIWSDYPKSPNLSHREHGAEFCQMLVEIHSDLKNMSIAVLDLRDQVHVELSDSDLQEIEKLTNLYVDEHRVVKRAQDKTEADSVSPSFRHHFDTLMSHSAIQFQHFDIKNRPRQYRRYITALVTESEVQKVYLPMLLQYASARRVRKHVQDFYQNRDPTLSIFWNNFGSEVLRKKSTVKDNETYTRQLQLVARESILKQLSAPYKRIVQSGGIPRGVAREAMLSFLGVVSRYLGDEDADEGDDIAALKTLLGPGESDEEYEPSGSESDSEPARRKPKKGGHAAKKSEKQASSSKNKGKSRASHAEDRSASDKESVPPAKPSKTRAEVSKKQGKKESAEKSSVHRAADEGTAPPARKSAQKSKVTEPQAETRSSEQPHAKGPSKSKKTVVSQKEPLSQELVSGAKANGNPQLDTDAKRAPAPLPSANASISDSRQGAPSSHSQVSETASATLQPKSRATVEVSVEVPKRANVERTNSRQSLARSPSSDEGIDGNYPASQASAKKNSDGLRSNEPGSSRGYSRLSRPTEEDYRNPIRNPFINLSKKQESQHVKRPVKEKASNPFAVKSKGDEDQSQHSRSTKGLSLTRKRSVAEDPDVQEIDALPAEKKTRVDPKGRKNFASDRGL